MGALGVFVVGESGAQDYGPHTLASLLLLGVDYDTTSSECLIKTLVTGNCLDTKLVFFPDLDVEGVRIIIAG